MTQHAYPKSDITIGNWTTAPLWSKIKEEPYSDLDYIQSAKNESNDYFEVAIDGLDDPITHNDHILRVRLKETKNSTLAYQIQLYQGVIEIATTVSEQIDGTSFAEKTLTLSTIEASNISSYLDLRARVVVTGGSAAAYAQVSWIRFECPNVAVGCHTGIKKVCGV